MIGGAAGAQHDLKSSTQGSYYNESPSCVPAAIFVNEVIMRSSQAESQWLPLHPNHVSADQS